MKIIHGTYPGYQKCSLTRWGACPECKAASAAYQRNRRANRPDVRAKDLATNKARTRALWKLARMYPDTFRELYEQERAQQLRQDGAA